MALPSSFAGQLGASPSLPLFAPRKRKRLLYNEYYRRKLVMAMALGLIAFFAVPVLARPIIHGIRDLSHSGIEILQMALSIRLVETILAILSVSLLTLVYGFLIQRGSLMSTTAMYPKRSIEVNIGKLLSKAWPDSSDSASASLEDEKIDYEYPIQLFYLGKMNDSEDRVAKGVVQCAAKPEGEKRDTPLWLTSGSPLIKDVVQLLVWEWTSLWLLVFMLISTLMYNGFFTNQLNLDSYPRLTVMIIYTVAYLTHSLYVWNACAGFLTNVGAGAAWSLLERAKFVVADIRKLRQRKTRESFEFRGIDKASAEYVQTTFQACFKHETGSISEIDSNSKTRVAEPGEDKEDPGAEVEAKDVSAALRTLDAAQKSERAAATTSVSKALDRVISNAMVMMGVTLSTGFSSWTSQQTTDNSPNNFDTTLIGSLALLASLSLGAATMFTSALHLSIMNSSYHAILSLKETKINGHALDHYKKRRSEGKMLSFTSGKVPATTVGFADILATNRWANFLGVLFLGPAFALLPSNNDYARTSGDVEFDLAVKVRENNVSLTTRKTDQHTRRKDGTNVEAINVCCDSSAGSGNKSKEKSGFRVHALAKTPHNDSNNPRPKTET